MLVIINEHGQFWTGECFGVRQAAELYTMETLPSTIDGLIGEGELDGAAYYKGSSMEAHAWTVKA